MLNYITSIPIEMYLLWGLRIGLLLFIVGLLLPYKNNLELDKALNENDKFDYKNTNTNKFIFYLDRITSSSFFSKFNLDTTCQDYKKINDLIEKSNCMKGLHPNIINFFRIISPFISFILLLAMYLIKLSIKTTSLQQLEQKATIIDGNSLNTFLQPTIISNSMEINKPHFSWLCFMWIVILSISSYMLPELLLKMKYKKRQKELQKELPLVETFIIIMLETNAHTVYSILSNLLETTKLFKPYISVCLNEYHINPQQAIQNMADKVGLEEFQIVCNGLKQAVDTNKQYTASFLKQHLDQLKKMQELKSQEGIKQKPILFVFLLALPLTSCITIWFYPWFVRAMNMLATGF